jgi:hypothetical protein
LNDDFDFGFTTHTVEELTTDEERLKQNLREIRKVYLPLLLELNKNPEREVIKWPNRKDLLDHHITKLKDLTNV